MLTETQHDDVASPAPMARPTPAPAPAWQSAETSDAGALVLALERLDRLLRRAITAADRLYGAEAAQDPYRGLRTTKEDVDRLLARAPLGPTLYWGADDKSTGQTSHATTARLNRLVSAFGLSPFDADALLIALAPEIDLRYERLYGYLQDDVTKKRPSVDLVLGLLCASLGEKLEARDRFAPTAPLFRNHLVRLFEDPSQPSPPLLSKYLKVDDRIVRYVLGSDELDALSFTAECVRPRRDLSGIVLSADVGGRLARLLDRLGTGSERIVVYLQGPYGVGKQSTAEALAAELDQALLVVDVQRLVRSDDRNVQTQIDLIFREALLQRAVLYWKNFDELLADDRRPWLSALLALAETTEGLTLFGGNQPWDPVDVLHACRFVRVELPRPTYAQRVTLWEAVLAAGADDVDPKPLANGFRLTGGQIQDAWSTARGFASWRDAAQERVTAGDLYAACRVQSSCKLSALAHKISPHYRWDDIVLPADRLQQLREVCNYVKYRSVVYDDWGFDRKLSLGKGVNVLFAGPSGTGKTMAAEIMAAELGTDLFKIDLSAVVSKFIGETEKNLAKIFDEAETSNAILFFDEADALFGKRSEVRDSHDRYANIETSYLLQRMEEYKGIVILATNFRKNMDEGFVRRLHSTVDFPMPDEADRLRIWRQLWPEELPRSLDLDLPFMARRCALPGGNIRNVALAAAFLAADDGGVVGMVHLIRAMQREYQKVGKVVGEDEFGEYAALLPE